MRMQRKNRNNQQHIVAKAAAAISRRKWWHVPPADSSAYAQRGKFYSSSYAEAEFYGISGHAVPERVDVRHPLVGDEAYVEMTLLGRQVYGDLPTPGTSDFYAARAILDRKLAFAAQQAGYDAIALLTQKGFAAFLKSGRLPRSIELNTFETLNPIAERRISKTASNYRRNKCGPRRKCSKQMTS